MLNLTTINHLLPLPFAQTNHRQQVRAIRKTYASWQQRFPLWANAGFDEYFLLHDALPLLTDMLEGTRKLEPRMLAQTWVTTFYIPQERRARAVAEATPVAADFLTRLQIEYGG